MRRLAKEVGVVGGDQIDEGIDLFSAAGALEEHAVIVVGLQPESQEPLSQPAGNERLPVGPEADPAVLVDEVGQEVVGLGREWGFGGEKHGGRGRNWGSAERVTPFVAADRWQAPNRERREREASSHHRPPGRSTGRFVAQNFIQNWAQNLVKFRSS